ncbi:leucine efflux protein LeuE [Janthinobacterium sp.]|uniref:leucine efflux protein LeuE n=1 Tax=Janthinobacterium sp. TaxID=1871054 RepID=UPI002622747D|nr:leucine efflux protein LeuE [Janthinobacterium sp.]
MNALMHANFGITDFWTFLLGTIFIVILPGPNSMYVLSVAAQRGVRTAYQGACGIFLGDIILMVLSACGVASLLKASPALFHVIKFIGAAYLGWIGLQMLVGCWRKLRAGAAADSAGDTAPVQIKEANPFRKALIISLMNPKAILFFISFFIQFVDPQFHSPAISFIGLGLICQICSFSYLTAIIFAGARLAETFRRRRRLSAGMGGGVGVMFIGFGAKLATATL